MFFDATIARLRRIIRLIALPIAASMFFLGVSAANADEIFVQIDGIEGESTTALRVSGPRPITANSWNWGMNQSASATVDGSRTSGKVNVQQLSFTHIVDKATPKLMEYCAIGRAVPNARLILRRPGPRGEPPVTYVMIALRNVIVSSISTGGGGSQERSTETVSLSFGAFEFQYMPMDATGKVGPDIKFGWSMVENKAL